MTIGARETSNEQVQTCIGFCMCRGTIVQPKIPQTVIYICCWFCFFSTFVTTHVMNYRKIQDAYTFIYVCCVLFLFILFRFLAGRIIRCFICQQQIHKIIKHSEYTAVQEREFSQFRSKFSPDFLFKSALLWNHTRGGLEKISSSCSIRLRALFISISEILSWRENKRFKLKADE